MKQPVKIGIGLACVIALGGFGTWFWSLGAVASEEVPKIRVEATHQPVELKKQGEEWKTLEAGSQIAAGDEVRTGADGTATIRWGDRGETRLDGGTDLVVDEAPADEREATRASLRLRVSSGRVWTRLLKLLDVESHAEVRTDSIVATVRGTAFGFGKTDQGAEVAVTESVVSVASANGSSTTLLRDNTYGNFDGSAKALGVRPLAEQDEWASKNRKADDDFDEAFRNEIAQRFLKRLPDAPPWLVNLSERLHMSVATGSAKSDLEEAYFGRAVATDALNPNTRNGNLKDVLPLDLDERGREQALKDLRDALFVHAPRRDSEIPKDLYANLQDARRTLLGEHHANDRYAEALSMDDAIDGILTSRLNPGAFHDSAAELLHDIKRLRGDVDSDSGLSDDEKAALKRKTDAMEFRLADFAGDVPTSTPPIQIDTTSSTSSTAPTISVDVPITPPPKGTVPKAPVVVTTTPLPAPEPVVPPPVTGCDMQRVSLFIKPSSNVDIGEAVALSLIGVCADGKTSDLTSSANFSTGYASDAKVSGSTLYPSKSGTITVYGTYAAKGKTMSDSGTVTVNKSVKKITSIHASASGSTSLTTGQGSPVQATATYSDNTTADVTYQCAWSTSDARMGLVSNQRFQSLSGTGTVSAICAYTENGVTLTGSVVFTIALDPALMPDAGAGCVPNYRIGKYCL